MADPTLKRSSVTIRYTASDGYTAEVGYASGKRTGVVLPPESAILEAIAELSRLAELFGFGARATEEQALARARVVEWRSKRGED